jgi:hypothetical protein
MSDIEITTGMMILEIWDGCNLRFYEAALIFPKV